MEAQVNFYREIVNMEVTEQFLAEQEAWFRSASKYAAAYSTLLLRLKSRTDEFVQANQPNQQQLIQAVPELAQVLLKQIVWLKDACSSEHSVPFVETLKRVNYLQRKMIEGTTLGSRYTLMTFEESKIIECKYYSSFVTLDSQSSPSICEWPHLVFH